MNTDRQVMNVTVPTDVYEEFKRICEENDRTISQTIRSLMRRYSVGEIKLPGDVPQ